MNDKSTTDEMISEFLLKQLPEAESDAIEEKFFTDPDFFERICAVENQLVDHYIRGRMSRKEQELFERNYLITPARRQKVAFAKSLARATSQVQTAEVREVNKTRETSVSGWRTFWSSLRAFSLVPKMAMALAVILAIGSLWAVFKINALRRDLIAADQERQSFEQRQQDLNRKLQDLERKVSQGNTQNEILAKELENLRQQREELEKPKPQPQTTVPAPASIASFLLLPGSVRGSESAKSLVLTPKTETVQIQIKFDSNDYSNYQVQVRTVEGTQVFSQRDLKARAGKDGATVSVKIPAKKLAKNDYLLTLSGADPSQQPVEVEKYFFRVKNN